LNDFLYYQPCSLEELHNIITQNKNVKFLSGGTDLIGQMKSGELSPETVIDLKHLFELSKIEISETGEIRIGALCTANEIIESQLIAKNISELAEIAEYLGSVQIRNRATMGGNICRAAPSADFAPTLIALDSYIEVISNKKVVKKPLKDFFLGPGKTVLGETEVVKTIVIPPIDKNFHLEIQRFSLREKMDLALVGVAVSLLYDSKSKTVTKSRIVLGSVGPTPLRAFRAEEELNGNLLEDKIIENVAKIASEESKPISDIYGSVWYKRTIVETLVSRALKNLQKKVN